MRPKLLLVLVVAAALLGLGFIITGVFNRSGPAPTNTVTITYKNSRDVAVYDVSESQDRVNKQLVTRLGRSGQSVLLEHDKGYIVSYRGKEGFESGSIAFDPSNTKKIDINPYFSENKLKSLLEGEFGNTQQAIKNKYEKVNLYEIQKGKLYHWGDWYATTLKYTGSDIFNSDTLRLVLHKENGIWEVRTDPPDISLSKFAYPDVPVDILRDVNNFQ